MSDGRVVNNKLTWGDEVVDLSVINEGAEDFPTFVCDVADTLNATELPNSIYEELADWWYTENKPK